MADRPGIMIYFETIPCLRELEDRQAGRLLRAILDYGAEGTVPDFSDDRELQITWAFIRQRIDQDGERYRQRVEQRRSAARSRWNKEAKKEELNRKNEAWDEESSGFSVTEGERDYPSVAWRRQLAW